VYRGEHIIDPKFIIMTRRVNGGMMYQRPLTPVTSVTTSVVSRVRPPAPPVPLTALSATEFPPLQTGSSASEQVRRWNKSPRVPSLTPPPPKRTCPSPEEEVSEEVAKAAPYSAFEATATSQIPVVWKVPPDTPPPKMVPAGAVSVASETVVPSGTTSVASQVEETGGATEASVPIPPPPPPYPAVAHAKLPAGVALPPVGQGAVEAELHKIALWQIVSAPCGKGIIRPKPQGAVQDFMELIPSFLAYRGLNRTRLEFVGNHEGWLEYRIHNPAIKSPGAKTVSENWNDKTKWPRGWVPAYHGGRWYGFWNTIAAGWINILRCRPTGRRRRRSLLCCRHGICQMVFETASAFSRRRLSPGYVPYCLRQQQIKKGPLCV
jgi:hypothetical protein